MARKSNKASDLSNDMTTQMGRENTALGTQGDLNTRYTGRQTRGRAI